MNRRGFTLIELLVVVAIIALLISILLPSLQRARDGAKAVVCASNMRQIATAVGLYLNENRDILPPSYVYPREDGSWGVFDNEQSPDGSTYGYLHWSHFLYSGGEVKEDAFQCPSMRNGGHPRTNPGEFGEDWEEDQVDDNNQRTGQEGNVTDRQAPRMAFGANAALMPRNKFSRDQAPSSQRLNVLVNVSKVKEIGIILATEFNQDWKNIAEISGNAWLSKSHRPILPFWHTNFGSGGTPELQPPLRNPFWFYGDNTITREQGYGLKPTAVLEAEFPQGGLIKGTDTASGGTGLNAVGRHHPGEDQFGGTANFLYLDGSVSRKFVFETMDRREWGEKFYSVTGTNDILYRPENAPQ